MAFIEIYLPDGNVEHFELTKASMTIGRSTEADICVQLPAVSRVHARIEKNAKGRWAITDLDSRNKIFFNKEAIKSHILTNRDVFYFGSIKAVFQDTSGASNEKVEQTVPRKSKKGETKLEDLMPEIRCSRCKKTMPDHTVICMNCGYNVKTGKSLQVQVNGSTIDGTGTFVAASPAAAKSVDAKKTDKPAGLTETKKELVMEWYLPAGLIALSLVLVAVLHGVGTILPFAIMTTLSAILIFIASQVAGKLGEFGFSSLGNAILKYFAGAAVYTLFPLLSANEFWLFMGGWIGLLVLMGLIILFFDTDFFGCFIIIMIMGIIQRVAMTAVMMAVFTWMSGGDGGPAGGE